MKTAAIVWLLVVAALFVTVSYGLAYFNNQPVNADASNAPDISAMSCSELNQYISTARTQLDNNPERVHQELGYDYQTALAQRLTKCGN